MIRKDLSVFSDPNIESLQANIYQKDAKLRIAFSLSSNSENNNPACTLSFNPMYFFVLGKPVLFDSRMEEEIEIDYKFGNERVIFEVKPGNRLQYIEFGVASRKLKNLGKLTIEEKIKQARTIRKIR